MSKFIKTVAAAAILATSATGPASAAALQTDVDISLPSVIALYCYDKVSVNVTTAGFVAATGAFDGGSVTNFAAGDEVDATGTAGNWDAAISGLDTTAGASAATTANLNMTGVCAFRAIASAAGVNVSISLDDGVLEHATEAGANITATAAQVQEGASYVTNYDVTSGLGMSNLNPITIRLPLDLSAATVAGTYSSEDVFTVTVVANL